MKKINIVSFVFLLFLLFSAVYMVGSVFFAQPDVPFVYGLKTKPANPVIYLPESNSSILPANSNTIGIYSTKKEHFFLKEMLQTSGIPYIFSYDFDVLKRTKIIFLDFDIDKPQTLTAEQNTFFHTFVKNGGVLIGNEILPTRYGAFKDLFGYRSYTPSASHYTLRLLSSEYYGYMNTPEEKNYSLSTLSKAPFTNMIKIGSAIPIACYEDNATAISLNHYGKGVAINLGISLFDLRYRNLFAKDFHANKAYINHFEPLSDFMILFLKGIYEQTVTSSLMLHTAKDGNQATVMMTHDVDFDTSIKNIPRFTAVEEKLGFRATYNIQVKYITDDKDRAFFLPKNLHHLLDAQNRGHEIGGHTIVHTKNFFLLPRGDCNESYPDYQPFSVSDLEDSGDPTVCGEVRVAKELLLGAGVKEVVSFRSGELLYNPHLPEVLEKFGYRYSSSFSAEDVLSYFPYRYMKSYKTLSDPSKVWEIPLVLEDEFFPPMYFRTGSALALFKKIYDNGAVYTILDHPDLTLYKVKNLDPYFIEDFYKKLPEDVWKPTMEVFGAYWDKRDRVVFRYETKAHQLVLTLYAPVDIEGLTFAYKGMKPVSDKDATIRKNKLILNAKKGLNQWVLELR